MGKKTPLYMAFIKDDNHDVTRGPAESYEDAKKRALDAEVSSDYIVETWVEEVK